MKILVTGMAGFIGFHLSKALADRGDEVIGIDNLNDYYDPKLKLARLRELGIFLPEIKLDKACIKSCKYDNMRFIFMDLTDRQAIDDLIAKNGFDAVCNLAAQAGVRYSLINPYSYIQSNIVGFLNILEACRQNKIKHLIYASSSSVYGNSEHTPYNEDDRVDTPESLYAATKKSDELMAYVYSKLYSLKATGLRFFTVYGPYGRPDMAPFIFMNAISQRKPIKVFNHGDMMRDFTYIDDIIHGILLVIDDKQSQRKGNVPHKVYNIGNSHPVALLDFIQTIEKEVGCKAICQYEDMQPGDVRCTYADVSRLEKDFGYHPSTSIEDGIKSFHSWFKEYYK